MRSEMHIVTVQTDSEGTYIVLPDGWRIEPAESEVLITQEDQEGLGCVSRYWSGWIADLTVDCFRLRRCAL